MQLQAGDKAPEFVVTDIDGNSQVPTGSGRSPVLLTFFRHAGCPMCNLRTCELILAKSDLDRYGVKVVGVFESSEKNIRRDVGRQDPPFPIIPDRKRRLYKLYGVSPSWVGFISIFVVNPRRVYEAIVKNRFIPKFGEVTPMMPAEFLIAPDGKIKLAYYGRDIGDHLPLPDLFNALNQLSSDGESAD